jgi:hypothetical protein
MGRVPVPVVLQAGSHAAAALLRSKKHNNSQKAAKFMTDHSCMMMLSATETSPQRWVTVELVTSCECCGGATDTWQLTCCWPFPTVKQSSYHLQAKFLLGAYQQHSLPGGKLQTALELG